MAEMAYSTNNEEFNYTEISEALEYAWDLDEDASLFTIYEGEVYKKTASSYAPSDLTENLSEIAYEEAGEFAEGWPSATNEQSLELQAAIKKTIDEWADKHKLQPTFFTVRNVKERYFRIVKESEHYDFDNFEEVRVL